MLLGFVPEELDFQLADGRRVQSRQEIVLGICPLPLRGLKGCRAIVHPEALLDLAPETTDAAMAPTLQEQQPEELHLLPVSAKQAGGALVEIELQLDLYKERNLA